MKWRINILEGFLLYVLWCGECYAYEVEGECDEDDGDFDEVCVHVDNNNIILLVEKYNWLGGIKICWVWSWCSRDQNEESIKVTEYDKLDRYDTDEQVCMIVYRCVIGCIYGVEKRIFRPREKISLLSFWSFFSYDRIWQVCLEI